MGNYKNLAVWEQARLLVKDIYALTSGLPSDERFGLSTQMQRAAVSIPCNIAEGSGRGSDAAYAQFVRFAIGSAYELETLVTLAADLNMVDAKETVEILQTIKDLRRRGRPQPKKQNKMQKVRQPLSPSVVNNGGIGILPVVR